MTTAEFLLARKLGSGGGGDVTVEELTVTENGIYQEQGKAYSPVKVEIPLDSKTITENGTYTASDDNLAGYDEVTVAVEGYAKKNIENTPTPIATFNASALPMPSLKVSIEAQQSGTGDPSPQNIRPITGWSAVNRYNYKAYQIISPTSTAPITTAGLTLSYEGKGKFRVKGKSTSAEGVTFVINYSAFTIYDGTDSYISLNNTIVGGVTAIFRNSSTQVDSWSFSVLNRTSSYVGMRGKTTDNLAINVGASLYDTDVDFTFKIELYSNDSKTTYTTTLKDGQGNPLTCYGGELSNENGVQSLGNGKAKKTFDGTENWVEWAAVTASSFVGFSVGGLTGVKGGRLTVMCNQLKSVDGLLTDNNCYIANGILYVCISKAVIGGDTIADFKTYLASNNLEIIYPLATPQTIPQDNLAIATQDGTNNIWADSGDVLEGSYFKELS